jgi:hypothetical protein
VLTFRCVRAGGPIVVVVPVTIDAVFVRPGVNVPAL